MNTSTAEASSKTISSLDIAYDNHRLFDALVAGMADLLEKTAGLDDASIFIGSIATELGAEIEKQYRTTLGRHRLSPEQLPLVLVDLANRAGGAFFIIEENEDRIVLGNGACPLGDAVRNHPSLCMLTSNIFGRMAANTVGSAAVDLEQTIATGAAGCRVVIHLNRKGLRLDTTEYLRDDATADAD